MSPRNTFSLVFSAAALLSASPCIALPGDNLADRIVLPSSGFPNYSGSTTGMTVDPGEINEAAGPAGTQDRSVWYEWTAPSTGTAGWSLSFASRAMTWGLAFYDLPPGGTSVSMNALRPAGAMVVPGIFEPGPFEPSPPSIDDRRVRLRVTSGKKYFIRIWSAPGPDGTDSGNFTVALTMTATSQRARGDLPDTASFLVPSTFTPEGSPIVRQTLPGGSYTIEPEEISVSGAWHPSGAVQWFEWTAPRTERFSFCLTEHESSLASVMVVRQNPDKSLVRLSSSGPGAAFDAVQSQTYLLRVATPWHYTQINLRGGPAVPNDEPATAIPLTPGTPASVRFAGASPSRLSVLNDNVGGRPDVWFDLGTSLTGPFRVNAEDNIVSIYRHDPAGSTPIPITGGVAGGDSSFLAEPGLRYLARVMERTNSWRLSPFIATIGALPPPPARDRRAGAQILPADGPVLLHGDTTGATAEESDAALGPGLLPSRTVWYALDRPASAEPWFVFAWNPPANFTAPQLLSSLYREENGTLVPAELPGSPRHRCALTGSRIWIMVSSNPDARFTLMAGPALSPGSTSAAPVPITTGSVHFLYAGASPPVPPSDHQSLWLSWTATQSGLVCFSNLGSPAVLTSSRFFLEDLTPVTSTVWNQTQGFENRGQVISFQAVAGTSYRIQLQGIMPGPVAVRIQPGGWQSPYAVWGQFFPAWENLPAFADPEADADADGISNLMEMAVLETRGPNIPDPPGFPWPEIFDVPGALYVIWTERTYAMRGPPGCIPLFLTGEEKTSLTNNWTALHGPAPAASVLSPHTWLAVPEATSPRAKFFRLLLHR